MTDRTTDHWPSRHYAANHIHGPIAFLNPTTRLHAVVPRQPKNDDTNNKSSNNKSSNNKSSNNNSNKQSPPDTPPPPPREDVPAAQQQTTPTKTGVYTVWRSRDNRKGRHALHMTPSRADNGAVTVGGPSIATSPSSSSPSSVRRTDTLSAALSGVGRMLLRWPVWDVSYDVAVIFTLGSIVWVCNGFFVLIPLINPASAFGGESAWGGGVSAVVGATIFELGSVLLMLEAVNENRSDCFGWALEQALDQSEADLSLSLPLRLRRQDAGECRHHHSDKTALLSTVSRNDGGGGGRRKWTWWPSWYDLRTHYLRDIGFLACLSQWIGATVFWISGFTGLPQILNVLTVPVENGIYWLPQVVGGTGFIVSSWLFMLETQSKWYLPAPTVLGWHIGFWNLIGALGFTLCGAFGFASSSEAYESALTWSTFVGSWAFLIGSLIQWYESLDKYPVIVDKKLPHSTTKTTTTTTTTTKHLTEKAAEA